MGIHTCIRNARQCRAADASARESKFVMRGEAVPRGIACQIVQYVHSGTIHT